MNEINLNVGGKVYRLTNKEMRDLYEKAGLIKIKQSTFLYFSLITEGTKILRGK